MFLDVSRCLSCSDLFSSLDDIPHIDPRRTRLVIRSSKIFTLPDDIACCFQALSASGITNMAANNLTYRRASLVLRFDSFLVASGQHL